MTYSHDVIVIGGGAAGLTAAGGCALFGLRVALIEAGKMGGECLNNGCVPSKALLAAASRAAAAGGAARMGVALASPTIDWRGVHGHVHAAIAAIAPHDSAERFEGMGCEVIQGYARVTGPKSVAVGGRQLTAPRIVLATGSRPAIPSIEGLDTVPYLTNETLFELAELPAHLLVVGGGSVGMEMAQAFCRLGSAVTLIEPDEILARDDRESAALAKASLESEGVRFVRDRPDRVTAQSAGLRLVTTGGKTLEGSHLLIAAGRRARVEGFGLEELGLVMGQNGIAVDARRRTSVRSIYAIGDCRDGPRLTHVAGYEGSNVTADIALGVPTKVDWRALPWCTYTDPQVAQIGLTENEARARYGDAAITIVREGFDHNDRAIAEGGGQGHCKLVMKGRRIVGASLCGKNVDDMLLPLAQAMTGKASSFALGSAVIAYPTRGEILKAATFAAWEPLVFSKWVKGWARLVAWLRRRL